MRSLIPALLFVIVFFSCRQNEEDNILAPTPEPPSLDVDFQWSYYYGAPDTSLQHHEQLPQIPVSAHQLQYTKDLGWAHDDEYRGYNYHIEEGVDSVFLLLPLSYSLPGDSTTFDLILAKKESITLLQYHLDEDRYSYDNIESFIEKFLYQGIYNEEDHFVKIFYNEGEAINAAYHYGGSALYFPSLYNAFSVEEMDTNGSDVIRLKGIFKCRGEVLSCGFMELFDMQNGTFRAEISY